MEGYDLIVIGSGPAGQRAAIQAAKFGKRVALVEKLEVVGGVAINTGTIPSKTIREAVLHLSGFYYQSIYGVNYRVKDQITMADLSFRAQHVIKTEIDVIRAQLSRNGIEILTGLASFVEPNHVRILGSRGQSNYEASVIVIATGTKPAVSPLVPFNGRNIINSDQILQMPQVPKTLIVVGGGVIGVEYACLFATLGVRVTLVEKRPRLLEFADTEIVEALCYHLCDRRVTLRLNEEVESVEEMPEVFANARAADARCSEFLMLAHRALAAATATSVHMEGAGMFYITGPNAQFIGTGLLDRLLNEMVKMSPLQGSLFEVIPTNDELGIIGAAHNAERAALASSA